MHEANTSDPTSNLEYQQLRWQEEQPSLALRVDDVASSLCSATVVIDWRQLVASKRLKAT